MQPVTADHVTITNINIMKKLFYPALNMVDISLRLY